MKKYTVTKRFVDGILKGLIIKEQTDVSFQVGRQYGYYVIDDIKRNF